MTLPRLAGLLALWTVACGGAGSGPAAVTAALEAEAVALAGPEGTSQRRQLAVEVRGAAPSAVHVGAWADGQGIERIDVSPTTGGALLDVRSRATLAAGEYAGTLTVSVCFDEACQRPLPGTPLRAAYTVTVTRALQVTPRPVTLRAVTGETADAAVAVTRPADASSFEAVVTSGAGWLAVTEPSATGFVVHAAARPPGVYLGAVRVTAGGATALLEVQYAVSDRPLAVVPAAVALSAVSGVGAEAMVRVSLPYGVAGFDVDPGAGGWLSVADATADGCTLRARSLPAGSYRATATITAGDQQRSVPVTYEVGAPPGGEHGILASPAGLSFTLREGEASAALAVSVTPPTWRPALQARVEYAQGAGWLALTPGLAGYAVQADAGALRQGSYSAALVLSGDRYTAELRVPIALTVGAGLVRPPDRELDVTAATTLADLSGAARVEVVSGPPRSWTAASSAPWLRLDVATGSTGAAVAYRVDPAHVAAMAVGATDAATVTVTPALATMSPVSFRVAVRRSLARVTAATPRGLPAGQPGRVLVRGEGFGALDPASPLVVDGVGPVTARRRSDAEIELLIPAAAPGAYPIRVRSALDLPDAPVALQLFAPGALPYTVFPQAGAKQGLVYDPVRRALFVVNVAQERLLRYQLQEGGAWGQAQRSVVGLDNIGLTGDGALLVAVGSTRTLRLIDPDTLADLETYDDARFATPYSASWYLPALAAIPVTNDGKAWLAGVPSGWAWDLAYFDLSTRRLGHPDLSAFAGSLFFHDGPWFSMSRDGERLLACQCDGCSPQPPLLYLDAGDGAVQASPAEWRRFQYAAQDDAGRRLILDSAIVYDDAYVPIGATSVPADFLPPGTGGGHWLLRARRSALSPDGARAYVLAFPALPAVDLPRVFVFDTRQPAAAGASLPLLGWFDLPEYPTCRVADACIATTQMAIVPDGRTLLLAGDAAVMVVPIPTVLTPP